MLDNISAAVNEQFQLDSVLELLNRKQTLRLKGLSGSSPAFVMREISHVGKTLLIVTGDFEKAAAIASDFENLGVFDIYLFPPTRKKPYESGKMDDLNAMVQRSEVLERLRDEKPSVIVASVDAIAEKLVPAEHFHSSSIEINKNGHFPPDELSDRLTEQGYTAVRFVDQPGEFAVRGGIFDVFPYSGEYPVRLEFFGDEIDSIREFDPDSQRSIAFLDKTRLVPNATYSENGNKEGLPSYLPSDTVVVLEDADHVENQIATLFAQAEETYDSIRSDDREVPAPSEEYLSPDEWNEVLKNYGIISIGSFGNQLKAEKEITFQTSPHPSFNGSFKLLREYITMQSQKSHLTLICTDSTHQKERFEELLGEPSGDFNYKIIIHNLYQGFILPDAGIHLLTDHEIFNRYHRPRIKRKQVRGGISIKELKELNIGDFVVHVDYGIGKFMGFKKIEVRGNIQEAAVLHYKGDSILYVNVSSLHKIQKYSGKEGKVPRITKLGSGEWARKKATTKKKVKDIARDLIELYAKRKAQQAFEFDPDNAWQTEMEARFEFEETPDQMTAIQAVKADMESSRPMDRLICGDVGFGKTEIAIRAAFKAVMSQKQVAVLVPTTILADQHFTTFSERMKDFPIKIEAISRFRSRKEQKEILENVSTGKTDILIGTHRIISKDVQFKDIGLLIIDEEQRFGVAVKEKLKTYRANIDVLTLTATPIPRTLQFSLMGARDLSIINTPPPNRQPVYTEIHSFSPELITEALLLEKSRGGQSFFIHNRVKNIDQVAAMIGDLVPGLSIRYAHGQMAPAQLEEIIHDFYHHKFDLLVSTNIVENGIDISNANTILINNADQFGLSELHQLRGRVGRSNRKAYCYLIAPHIQQLTPDARKRLTALEEYSDLGSGFNIAMRDLDIRGAGDILGAEQSGYISDIGFEMYTKILDDAVRELKENDFKDLFDKEAPSATYPETKVEFDASAYLDSEYVQDNVERLNLYRKLSDAATTEQVKEWKEELEDRFGPLPKSGLNLLKAALIKQYGSKLFMEKITIRADRMWLVCVKNSSSQGDFFYNGGLFQQLIREIQEETEHPYQVVQNDDSVTLVIKNIGSVYKAVSYLNRLSEKLLHKPEPAL